MEMKSNEEEPADLSSPSRIRAFLLGLPPFQVKLEEDLNGARFGKFLPAASKVEAQRTEAERIEVGGGGGGVKKEEQQQERAEAEKQEEKDLAPLLSGPELKREPANTDAHCF